MSQSAENQSAMIENENNANIVMESQAAMSAENENPPAEAPMENVDESMDVGDDVGQGGEPESENGQIDDSGEYLPT